MQQLWSMKWYYFIMLLLHDFHVLTQFNHLFYSFLIAIIWTMRASSRMHHREREKGPRKYNNDASSNFLLSKSLFVTAIAMNISMISYCHVAQAIPGRFISSSHIPGRFVSSSPSPHEKCLASSSVKEESATAEANLPVIGETGSLHSVIAAGSVTQVDISLHLLAHVLYCEKVSILVCDVVVLKQLLLQAAVLWSMTLVKRPSDEVMLKQLLFYHDDQEKAFFKNSWRLKRPFDLFDFCWKK